MTSVDEIPMQCEMEVDRGSGILDELGEICALQIAPRAMSADDVRSYWEQCHARLRLVEAIRSAHVAVFGSIITRALTSVEKTAVRAAIEDQRGSWMSPGESHNCCWICGRAHHMRQDVPYAPAGDGILRNPPLNLPLQVARTCGDDVCVHRAREHGPVGLPCWSGRQLLAEMRKVKRSPSVTKRVSRR